MGMEGPSNGNVNADLLPISSIRKFAPSPSIPCQAMKRVIVINREGNFFLSGIASLHPQRSVSVEAYFQLQSLGRQQESSDAARFLVQPRASSVPSC